MSGKWDLSQKSLNVFTEESGDELYQEKVTSLDLSSNYLTTFSPSVSTTFSNLLTLDISENRFTEFPVQLCALHRLQVLSGKLNQMKSLPRDFSQLRNLKKLNLSGNRFELFPPQLCELEGLEYVHVGGNAISYIPPSIKRLKRYVM